MQSLFKLIIYLLFLWSNLAKDLGIISKTCSQIKINTLCYRKKRVMVSLSYKIKRWKTACDQRALTHHLILFFLMQRDFG